MFANPLGVEVLPLALARADRLAARGAIAPWRPRGDRRRSRARGTSCASCASTSPGDPFKRIAWKASARRGRLLVREMEREERDVVWLVLDASVELWAGAPGRAPLDFGVDEVAALATRHLARGDRVGLVVDGVAPAHLDPAGDRGGARDAHRRGARERREHGRQRPLRARRARDRAARGRARAPARSSRAERPAEGGPRRARGARRDAPRARPVRAAPAVREDAARAAAPALPRRLRHRGAAARRGGARADRRRDRRGAREARAPTSRARASSTSGPPSRRRGHRSRARCTALEARHAEVRWTLPPFEQSVGDRCARRRSGAELGSVASGAAREPSTVAEVVDEAVRARAVTRGSEASGRCASWASVRRRSGAPAPRRARAPAGRGRAAPRVERRPVPAGCDRGDRTRSSCRRVIDARALLREASLSPKKSFGQNFLVSERSVAGHRRGVRPRRRGRPRARRRDRRGPRRAHVGSARARRARDRGRARSRSRPAPGARARRGDDAGKLTSSRPTRRPLTSTALLGSASQAASRGRRRASSAATSPTRSPGGSSSSRSAAPRASSASSSWCRTRSPSASSPARGRRTTARSPSSCAPRST